MSNTGLARGESVLSMHSLALVDPRAIEVATPKRVRRRLPSWVEPVSAPKGERTTSYEGIPSQCVADAIECCTGSAMPARSSRPPSRRAAKAWSPPASTIGRKENCHDAARKAHLLCAAP